MIGSIIRTDDTIETVLDFTLNVLEYYPIYDWEPGQLIIYYITSPKDASVTIPQLIGYDEDLTTADSVVYSLEEIKGADFLTFDG